MKFLIDMPASPNLIPWLEASGHDAQHALSLGLGTAPDTAIMARAKIEGRIVITADLDFGNLLAMSGETSPGVILFRGGNYSDAEMQDLVRRTLEAVKPDVLQHAIVVVDKRRVRITHLPLKRP